MDEQRVDKRKREIIDLLVSRDLITQQMVDKARDESKRTGMNMLKALDFLGFIAEEDIAQVEADVLGIPYLDLSEYAIDSSLINLIPRDMAKEYKVVPLFKIDETVSIGMVDPQDVVALDKMRRLSDKHIFEPVLVSEAGILKVFSKYYEINETIDEIVQTIEKGDFDVTKDRGLDEIAKEAPVVKLVNVIFNMADKDHVSDIHVEPDSEQLRIRFRMDGVLREVANLPKKVQNAFISRIKILSGMDIAENRKPQDGRIGLEVNNKELDLRVSSFPTLYGENVVLRILDKSPLFLGLKRIGFLSKEQKEFEALIRKPNGIILVTGPTGSGKTSTLYSALASINSMEKNIITIENPIEYELPLIRQTQVNEKAGITFANGLRSILRQDPDIIMVGEIRDRETADVAVQAALTGHLVFSTLHTNDACSAATRLIDMGIEPFLISSSVKGVLAQRLVRTICESCKEPSTVNDIVLKELELDGEMKFYHGRGCPACKDSGFKGRLAIVELLILRDQYAKLIEAKASAEDLKKLAISEGMKTMRQNGLIHAQHGLTTIEEVLQVTAADQ